jgi:group II intron reverse transcriptase/maturase
VDRVVQQALLQVLEPVFEPTFHDSSHGFRPRRGAQTAIAQAKGYVQEGFGHVVDVDLSKFFDRVNHQRLLGRMAQRIDDGRVLRLVHRMLKAEVVLPEGTVVSTDEGTPQGGPLSPLLSNIVLDELDRELGRRGLRFVRYADDFMVFVRSERSGHRVMASIQRFIEGRLRLKVNQDKSRVDRPEHLHFLGFTLRRRQDGHVEVDLSERTKQRINDRVRELTPRLWGGSLSACIERVNRYLRGHVGDYLVNQFYANLYRGSGDGGYDFTGLNLDVKAARLLGGSRDLLDYRLAVHTREWHADWVYVLVVVDLENNVAHIIGWATAEDFPNSPVSPDAERFAQSFVLAGRELNRVPPFRWRWIPEPMGG